MANYDDELNGVSEAISTSVEEGLVGLIGATSGSFKSAQSGLKLLKDKLAQRKEAKSQELKIQIGRNVVFKAKPGQKSETSMTADQGRKLNKLLQDPSKAKGSLKVSFGKEKVLHISQGKVVADKLGLLHESQAQVQAENKAQTEAQTPEGETQAETKQPTERETQKNAGPIPGLDNDFTPEQNTPEQNAADLKGIDAFRHIYEQNPDDFSRRLPSTAEQLNNLDASKESVAEALKTDLQPTQYPDGYSFLDQVSNDPTSPNPVGKLSHQVREEQANLQDKTQQLTNQLTGDAPYEQINTALISTTLSKVRLQDNQQKAVKATQEFEHAIANQPELKENFSEFIQKHDDVHPSQSWDKPSVPVQAEIPAETQEPAYESPVGKVLDVIDNAPGLPPLSSDPIAKQNQINEYHPPTQQQQAPSKDEVIEQLRSQLQQQSESVEKLSEQVTQLSERVNNLSPIKLANEQLGSWVNQKRNAFANAIRAGADRLAQGIEQHNESTAKLAEDVKETVDKVKAGFERHDKAVGTALDKAADVRDKVTGEFNQAVDKTKEVAQQAKQTHQQVTDSAQYKKGVEFFKSVAEPAVKAVVQQLDRIGGVNKDEHGNRTLESKNYNWTLTSDNQVQIVNKESGQQVTPSNLDQSSLDTIKAFASKAQERGYLLAPAQTQTQSQAPVQAPVSEAPKQAEAPKPAAIKV